MTVAVTTDSDDNRFSEIGRHLKLQPGEVKFALWTPLSPEEIAIELRPFLASEALPWDPGPTLVGMLSSLGLSLRWQRPRHVISPEYVAGYRSSSGGTILDGVVVPARPTRFDLWVIIPLSIIQLATLIPWFVAIATNPEPSSILAAAALLMIGCVAVISVTVYSAVAARRAVRDVAPWYRHLLIDALMAEEVGGET